MKMNIFPESSDKMFFINRKWSYLSFLITENVDLIEERCSMIFFFLGSGKGTYFSLPLTDFLLSIKGY